MVRRRGERDNEDEPDPAYASLTQQWIIGGVLVGGLLGFVWYVGPETLHGCTPEDHGLSTNIDRME